MLGTEIQYGRFFLDYKPWAMPNQISFVTVTGIIRAGGAKQISEPKNCGAHTECSQLQVAV